jgi:hypothetical protein
MRPLIINSSGVSLWTAMQWAPTLTVHDPNPPITLNDPVGGAFSIIAALGSYSKTGLAGTLVSGRLTKADAGGYNETGSATGLAYGRVIAALSSSYSISGSAATILAARPFTATLGAYTVSGIAATLLADHPFFADFGSYTVVGFEIDTIQGGGYGGGHGYLMCIIIGGGSGIQMGSLGE